MDLRKESSSSATALGKTRDVSENVMYESAWGWVNLRNRECYDEREKVFKQMLEYFHSKVMGRPHRPYLIPMTSVLLTQCLCWPIPVVSKGPRCQELIPAIRHLPALSVLSGAAQLRPVPPGLTHLLCQLWFSTTHQEETRSRLCEAP